MSSIGQFLKNRENYLLINQKEHEVNIQYFRDEFDNITNLINLYKANKGKYGFKQSVYDVISIIAFDDDIAKNDMKLTKHQVVDYINIVRLEKECDDE